jgi:hypothetical protein
MSRRRLAKGVAVRHVDDKDVVSQESAPKLVIKSRADIAKMRAKSEKPEVKKPIGNTCKHCGKPYKLKMHLVRHEKGCKEKE